MDEKIKTWTLRFPAKENFLEYGERIVRLANSVAVWRQSEVRLISRKFFGHDVFSAECSLNQPKPTSVCIRSTN